MSLMPKERSDFVRELSESIDNTNPKQVFFKRQFINALMKKETARVDGFSAEELFFGKRGSGFRMGTEWENLPSPFHFCPLYFYPNLKGVQF